MRVDVLRSTANPEQLICQAARGDMYSGYIGDTEYSELMESVEASDEDIEAAIGVVSEVEEKYRPSVEEVKDSGNVGILTSAKTRSFIRKQASRGHWGIWEHPSITFSIEGVSRVTMAQITRHRHLSFDIQSMRYVNFDDPDYAIPESLTNEDHFTRSEGMVWEENSGREDAKTVYEKALKNCTKAYENLLELGVPAEDARYALPLSTQVNVTMSGNSRTMLHLLNLRSKASAQYEIRELSDLLLDELFDWAPYTFNWYQENKPHKIGP